MASLLDAYLIPSVKERLKQAGVMSREELVELLQSDNAVYRLCSLRGIGGHIAMGIAKYACADGIIGEDKLDAVVKTVTPQLRKMFYD